MRKETDYIYGIPKFNKKSTLENTKEMLRRLGVAGMDVRIIHVAGTNGKGSVCAYLGSMLREEGFHVGVFTSPHLVVLNERISIDGEPVSDEMFEAAFGKVKKISCEMMDDGFLHPSFFEFLFGMAMLIFSKQKLDYIILETGLGGRLDATNVFDFPAVTVITSISLDHMDILGDTIEEIAGEKAGIIKHNVPVVYDARDERVNKIIERVAKEHRSAMCRLKEQDITVTHTSDKKIDFSLNNSYYDNVCFSIETCALYQVYNATLALNVMAVLGFSDIDILRKGLSKMNWAGRMQHIRPGFVIDGAHNDDGIRMFLNSVECDATGKTLIFSCVKDKHYESVIKEICNAHIFNNFILTPLADPRGLDIHRMRECFKNNNVDNVFLSRDSTEACKTALLHLEKGQKVYAVGSLYLVGEILEWHNQYKEDNNDKF